MTFEADDLKAKIDRLGVVAVTIGVNLQPGQELIVNAPVEAVPLVRAIATHAYRAGAAAVSVQFSDQELARIHLTEGAEPSFDHASAWRYDGLTRGLSEGAALLAVTGTDPNLLAGCDPARKARTQKAQAIAARGIQSLPARSASTGPSCRLRARPGRWRYFRNCQRRRPFHASGGRFFRRRGSTGRTRLRTGGRMWQRCMPGQSISTNCAARRCISAVLEPICGSG